MSRLGDLHFLVGLPASGKSTFAGILSKEIEGTILSSDELRKELYGDENDQTDHSYIFSELYKRANRLMNIGKNVIIDATNISRKKRVHAINNVLKAESKTAYYMNNHFNNCLINNQERSRKVPYDSIERMYKNMQIPVHGEGWDNVVFISDIKQGIPKDSLENRIKTNLRHPDILLLLGNVYGLEEFKHIYDLPQDSKYHSFSVSRHTHYVYEYIKNNSDDLTLLWASLFHDLGKGFCKSFKNYKGEEKRYANFIGHEYVSSQLAAYYLYQLGYEDQLIKDVSALCQFHMYPMSLGEKKMDKIKNLLGDKLFEKLLLLHEADIQAK